MRGLFPTRHRVAQCHFSLLAARWKKPCNGMAGVHFWGSHTKAQRGWKQQGREQTFLNCPAAWGIWEKTYLFLICWDCGMKPLLCATRLESFDITIAFMYGELQKPLCLSLSFVTLEGCSADRRTSQIARHLATPSSWGHFCAHKTSPKGQKASKPLPCTPVVTGILLRTCKRTTAGQVQELLVSSA